MATLKRAIFDNMPLDICQTYAAKLGLDQSGSCSDLIDRICSHELNEATMKSLIKGYGTAIYQYIEGNIEKFERVEKIAKPAKISKPVKVSKPVSKSSTRQNLIERIDELNQFLKKMGCAGNVTEEFINDNTELIRKVLS